jgi:hypothetical protein
MPPVKSDPETASHHWACCQGLSFRIVSFSYREHLNRRFTPQRYYFPGWTSRCDST